MASAGSDVYVKLPSGQTVTLSVLPGDTVSKMACETAHKAGIAADRLRLKYQGKILNPSHTAGYLGVRVETILKAEVIEVKHLTLYVKTPSGSSFPVEVENISPVQHIKNRIMDIEDIPSARQVLKIGNRALTNTSQSLVDAGITNEAIITLEIQDIPSPPEPDTSKTGDSERRETDTSTKVDKEAVMGSFDAAGKPVEVVFCFDTTGSMYSCLTQVRSKLREACSRLLSDIPNIKIGVIAHGDYCDQAVYVVRMTELTSDVDRLVDFVNNVPATSGGDSPECYEWALHKAQQLDWSEHSAKALVMIGDCLPHPASYTDQKIKWHDELDVLKGMGIKVYGMQAFTHRESEPFYREMSEYTGGAYVNFNHFDVITDMFLAVCYREAAPEQLEAYLEEVTQEGRMEGEMERVLQQVHEARPPPPQATQRYVAEGWWDPSMDHGDLAYSYDAQTDAWSAVSSAPSRPTARPSSYWTSDTTASPAPRPASSLGRTLRQSFRRLRQRLSRKSTHAPPADTDGS